MTKVGYPELEAALLKAGLGVGAAELHGSLTGYLCAGQGGRAHELLTALALESDDAGMADDLHALLEPVAAGIAARLRAGEAVSPLLPGASLPVRVDAMVDWSRGFLGGLGLTGAAPASAHAAEVAVLLQDLGRIASMRLECDDDDENVQALEDVLDFIRGAVVRLHALLAPVGRA